MASLIGPLALSGALSSALSCCLVVDPMASTRSWHSEATISLPPSLERLYHWWSCSCPYAVQHMPVQLWPTEVRSVFSNAVVMQRRRMLDGATAGRVPSSEQRLEPGLRHFRWCAFCTWEGQKAW